MSSLGEGNSSKVYLVRNKNDSKNLVALKLFREDFLKK
jgi:hypothetical protein